MTSRLAPDCQFRPPWRTLAGYLRQLFGHPLRKLPLDPGFGCPHRDPGTGRGGCSFCAPEGFVPKNARLGGTIGEQVDRALGGDPRLARGFIAYLQGGTGTFAPAEAFARVVGEALGRPQAKGLFIGTRPDCLAPEHLAVLAPWAGRRLIWLEIGLPSASDQTLARVGRGHGAASFLAARELARRHGFPVCAHVILGLPGEGEKEVEATARFLAQAGVEGVKLHQLQVLRGTPMEAEWRRGGVGGLELERYAILAARFLACLPPATVVHRLAAEAPPHLLLAPRWGEAGGKGMGPGGWKTAVRELVARELRSLRGRGGEGARRSPRAGGEGW